MPLQPDQVLLHYRLTAKLGEGGMGQVWQATDTTLDRQVAIKILPESFAADPDRLARFEREAKMLAALNHPGIAAVYSFHSAESTHFLAMELVQGEDLSARLQRGPLPPDEALTIATHLAEALEAAHEKGIIHRDLKPANLRITPEGNLKVLDFGLAKAFSAEPDPSSDAAQHPSMSPTLTSAGTRTGMILGTAAYMSPEQAKGYPVDTRADIWAFGAVLYEMLTGRPAFKGDTVSELLASVLRDEPDLERLPQQLSPDIRRLIERCLRKDPRRRLRDIGDARIELQEPQPAQPSHPTTQAPAGPRTWYSRGTIRGAILGAIIGFTGYFTVTSFFFNKDASTVQAPEAPTMRRLTELPGPELHPHLSPDGRQLIYASEAGGNLDIYLLRVGGDRAINLTAGSPDGDWQGQFSPDGEHIVFRSERDGGGLFTMGATGESVRRITDFGSDPCWSPDGRHVAFATELIDDPYSRTGFSMLWRVEVETGQTTQLTETGDAVQPAWSPDGKRIAYWANTGGQRDIWLIAAGGGDPVPVTQDRYTDWSPVWSPDGRWLYFSSDRGGSMNLWRLPVDAASGEVRGDPQPVTTGTRSMGHAGWSRDGRRLVVMAYERGYDVSFYEMASLLKGDRTPLRRLGRQTASWCVPSPDASWLACSTRGAHEDLILMRADGSETRRLTDDYHKDRAPDWGPDGDSLLFYSTRSGAWNYWWIGADGSGLRQITAFEEFGGGISSPDGKRVALNADIRGLVIVDVDVEEPVSWKTAEKLPMPDGYPDSGFWPMAWSPDGRWLAGSENDGTGRLAGYAVYDLENRALRRLDVRIPASQTESENAWLADSRSLVLKAEEGLVIHDTVAGTNRLLLPWHPASAVRPTVAFHLARNGELLMIEQDVLDSEIWLLDYE